jgi:putative intracellular protease/amidase
MKVVVPLPRRDFDPTEVAVPWRVLTDAGHEVFFATPDGQPGRADPRMLSGEGLDPRGFLPGLSRLRLIGLSLRAGATARAAYAALERDVHFERPLRWNELAAADFDALLLPGAHAKGMREYRESTLLQKFVAAFFGDGRPVAAICHGVVLAARSLDPKTARSVLHGRRTTALTWSLEKTAWDLTRYFARFWDPGYYRTYEERPGEPAGFAGVQQEVTRALARAEDFLDVPPQDPDRFRKTSGLFRDRLDDARPAFVVRDGSYVSARWPGDAYTFARVFCEVIAESGGAASTGDN